MNTSVVAIGVRVDDDHPLELDAFALACGTEAAFIRLLIDEGLVQPLAWHPAWRFGGEELALGIERAAAFLQTSNKPAGSLARLYLTGGGSRVPGLAGVLSDRLRVPVTQAHAVERLTVAPGAFDGLSVDEVSPLLMLPVGLALRAVA